MFNFFSRKNKSKSADEDGIEYTFIWYKKMKNGNSTHYTAPFRTKVKARTREEAVRKVKDFALRKMELVIVEEKDFSATDISMLEKSFANINKLMQEAFGKFDKL